MDKLSQIGLLEGRRFVPERTQWLISGLRNIGIVPGDILLILCCGEHADDALALENAASTLGARAIVEDLRQGIRLPRNETPKAIFACADGTRAWQATGRPGRLIGDGPGLLWWRAWELAARAADPGPVGNQINIDNSEVCG